MKSSVRLLLACAASLSAFTASAHHSTSQYFDVSKEITVEGEFDSLKIVNPHSVVTFYVTNAKGERQLWRAETHAAGPLLKYGWKNAKFNKGEKVSVVGNPSRDGSPALQLMELRTADGYVLNPQKQNQPRQLAAAK